MSQSDPGSIIKLKQIESTMDLELRAEKRNAFDSAISALVPKLELHPVLAGRQPLPGSESERMFPTISRNDILEFGSTKAVFDLFGKQQGIVFDTPRGSVGLVAENFAAFRRHVAQFCSYPQTKDLLSVNFVARVAFDWIRAKYEHRLPNGDSVTHFLENKADEEVLSRNVAIRLTGISIEEPLMVGRVKLDFLKRDEIDAWEARSRELREAPEDQIRTSFDELRRDVQGVVLATMVIRADIEKSKRLLTEETDRALVILRFCSPSAREPELPLGCGKLGHVLLPVSSFL